MPSIWTPVGILTTSPSTVIALSTVSGKALVAPILSNSAPTGWLSPFFFRSRKNPASASMNRLGGVPATIRLTKGLSPAVSCGTDAALMVFPVFASNVLRITFKAPISLSFDQVWNNVSSTAAAGAADSNNAAEPPNRTLRNVIVSSLCGLPPVKTALFRASPSHRSAGGALRLDRPGGDALDEEAAQTEI